ncbi:Tex-like N-terminal domain-containing protein, partial [Desulfocurvibacter africanus]|uniref:Tex-like N-terminal domain-containing protein n=1 Tax=Desulfocurvibacter africanus TaxID=873 RepID=UPI002FD9F1E2
MIQKHIERVAAELGLAQSQVRAVAELIEGGATVPFIARYRKEATGSLDEVAVTAIRDRLEALAELDKRREAILSSLEERGLLTDELKSAVVTAPSLAELEDIYLPYRPKRRTRAMIAMEKGLEPLALAIMEQGNIVPAREAEAYVNADKGVGSVDEALA